MIVAFGHGQSESGSVATSTFARSFGAPGHGEYFSLNLVLKEDFRFSSAPEFGLEAADILVNAIRRSLAGNLGRQGWLPIRELMVHRTEHYIRLISMAPTMASLLAYLQGSAC